MRTIINWQPGKELDHPRKATGIRFYFAGIFCRKFLGVPVYAHKRFASIMVGSVEIFYRKSLGLMRPITVDW